jgi:hypothetical protein
MGFRDGRDGKHDRLLGKPVELRQIRKLGSLRKSQPVIQRVEYDYEHAGGLARLRGISC